jgi:ketosteroid isomerase-like protein
VVDRGSYMQIWKRQADGRWLFAREIWNASAPPVGQP